MTLKELNETITSLISTCGPDAQVIMSIQGFGPRTQKYKRGGTTSCIVWNDLRQPTKAVKPKLADVSFTLYSYAVKGQDVVRTVYDPDKKEVSVDTSDLHGID
jgi:hypothetical protein